MVKDALRACISGPTDGAGTEGAQACCERWRRVGVEALGTVSRAFVFR